MSSRKKNAIACVALYVLCEKEERTPRKIWVKQWRINRERFGHMPLMRELRENNPEDYRNYLRMDDKTFQVILNLVRPYITKKDTIMRTSISAEERLAVTLRYLATGRSLQDLKFSSCISAPALCSIIPETCWAIYTAMKNNYLKVSFTKRNNYFFINYVILYKKRI